MNSIVNRRLMGMLLVAIISLALLTNWAGWAMSHVAAAGPNAVESGAGARGAGGVASCLITRQVPQITPTDCRHAGDVRPLLASIYEVKGKGKRSV